MQDEDEYDYSNYWVYQHQLIVKDTKGERPYTSLDAINYSIGKAPRADIRLCTPSPLVARHHATLVSLGEPPSFYYQLIAAFAPEDGGRFHLWVNGKPVQTHVLQSGDEIDFGGGVSAVYYHACPMSARPSPPSGMLSPHIFE